jgi:hypothetical protein
MKKGWEYFLAFQSFSRFTSEAYNGTVHHSCFLFLGDSLLFTR